MKNFSVYLLSHLPPYDFSSLEEMLAAKNHLDHFDFVHESTQSSYSLRRFKSVGLNIADSSFFWVHLKFGTLYMYAGNEE